MLHNTQLIYHTYTIHIYNSRRATFVFSSASNWILSIVFFGCFCSQWSCETKSTDIRNDIIIWIVYCRYWCSVHLYNIQYTLHHVLAIRCLRIASMVVVKLEIEKYPLLATERKKNWRKFHCQDALQNCEKKKITNIISMEKCIRAIRAKNVACMIVIVRHSVEKA